MSNKSRQLIKIVCKGLLFTNAALILFFWWKSSGSSFSQGFSASLIALGRLSGLFAVAMVLLQFVYMGRNLWLERTFGLDKLARIHRLSGQWSIFLILLHPLLLTIGYSQLSGVSLVSQFLSFLTEYEDVLQAFMALLLFCVVVATSITVSRRRMRYELWYFIHLLVYLAVYFSFGHQFHNGTDLLSNHLFYGYWIMLYTVVLTSFVIFRFMRPLYRFARYQFTVSRIIRENYNIISIYITGHNLAAFPVQPGQFMIFRFLTKNLWWQAHPFSLSMVPDGKEIRITVKELGDYTEQIKDIPIGTKVIIDGPYGVFTEHVLSSNKALFIAGGIGITPIRSLLEQFAQKKRDAILLYANKSQKDIALNSEVQKISAKLIHILSDEPGYTGEVGFIDEEKIKRLVPDFMSRDIYLCGPPAMMDALLKALKKLGVPVQQIHYERFAL